MKNCACAGTRSAVHPNDELLTSEEMAESMRISKDTLYKWTCNGRFAPPGLIKLPNGQLRITRADLMAWLRGLTV
jgi:excisionase family DNA binding protein